MTAPQQGSGFVAAEADLKQAQHDFDIAAGEVQREFKELEAAVLENRSKGDAFTAAQQVARALRTQSNKFVVLVDDLGDKVGVARKKYMQVNAAGAEQIGSVEGMTQGTTFNRLVPDSRA